MLGLTPRECHTRRQEACRKAVRAFQWRTRLVTKATEQYGVAEESAAEILTSFRVTLDALASEIWIRAHGKRVAVSHALQHQDDLVTRHEATRVLIYAFTAAIFARQTAQAVLRDEAK